MELRINRVRINRSRPVAVNNNITSIHLHKSSHQGGSVLRGSLSGGAIAVYVGCIYDPVISVRVLHLFHNNSVNYS